LNVKASGVGPSVVRRPSRASPSSAHGTPPGGCHHRPVFGRPSRSKHSWRRLSTVSWSERYAKSYSASIDDQTLRFTRNSGSSLTFRLVFLPLSPWRPQTASPSGPTVGAHRNSRLLRIESRARGGFRSQSALWRFEGARSKCRSLTCCGVSPRTRVRESRPGVGREHRVSAVPSARGRERRRTRRRIGSAPNDGSRVSRRGPDVPERAHIST
jgi:hypothetical protein